MKLPQMTPWRTAASSMLFLIAWRVASALAVGNEWAVAGMLHTWGWLAAFVLGFCWMIWGAERLAQRYEAPRGYANEPASDVPSFQVRIWNPFDTQAWYYGRHAPRLRQTMLFMTGYSVLFLAFYLLVNMTPEAAGGDRPFELPEGGGSDQSAPAARTMKVQKQIRRKFVINPYSSILFSVPSIDRIDVKVAEETSHQYRAGYGGGTGTGTGGIGSGTGKGSGFGSGTGSGKVRLPRLKHAGRGWDKNFGIGGDNNMLVQFSLLTQGMKVEEKTEIIEAATLARFTPAQAPPLVLVTGTDGFSLSPTDKRSLKQYLLEKNGMILGDNLGGGSFHNQFIQTMREVTGVQEVPIPRDDYIHARPELLPALPIVVAHGGTTALGWKVDGRWVAYYHPGALTDAWRDDHAGIKREIWQDCYRLGTNIIFYAYLEKHKWNEARKQR